MLGVLRYTEVLKATVRVETIDNAKKGLARKPAGLQSDSYARGNRYQCSKNSLHIQMGIAMMECSAAGQLHRMKDIAISFLSFARTIASTSQKHWEGWLSPVRHRMPCIVSHLAMHRTCIDWHVYACGSQHACMCAFVPVLFS